MIFDERRNVSGLSGQSYRKRWHWAYMEKEWLPICSSEGGLFEYCSDEVIVQILKTIHDNSVLDIIIAGSLMHNIETIDRDAIAAMKISTSIKPRFLGIDVLKKHNRKK